MILCTGTYVDQNPARMRELLYCLRKNIENPHFRQIDVALEDDVPIPYSKEHTELLSDPRVHWFTHLTPGARGFRMTYADWFKRSNNVQPEVMIIANADIYFDDTVQALTPEYLSGKFACLSRRHIGIDETGDRPVDESAVCAQDAWAFVPPLRIPAGLDFTTGCPGCDNRVAAEMDAAGYQVVNPSLSVHAFHVHVSMVKHYGLAVPGPHKLVSPSRI